jgi:aspartyl-tRNA(Asn)/glutamyl-tRNA(Gln) amidotransferase subunit C
MEIRREEIAHVAKLSKLALSETELEQMQQALVEILENMKTLEELELGDMSALAEAALVNVFREDVIQPSAPRDVLLQNAPARNADSMIVPKTVE